MSLISFNNILANYFTDLGLIQEDFVMIDVGCSGGIDPVWLTFGENLFAYGIDPQKTEIERLKKDLNHKGIKYHTYFIGSEESEYGIKKTKFHKKSYMNPVFRTSSSVVIKNSENAKAQSNPIFENVTENWITLPDFIKENSIKKVDFIKIDTDGNDIEILHSISEQIENLGVLGIMIESNFVGTADKNQNSFFNIDEIMKKKGFHLYNLSISKYSKVALPSKFKYNIFAQTEFGQPVQCDLVYLKDGASEYYNDFFGKELTKQEVLKLACLYEIFKVPDLAAEILLLHKNKFDTDFKIIEPLNLLTKKITRDKNIDYKTYIENFQVNPSSFLPGIKENSENKINFLQDRLNDAKDDIALFELKNNELLNNYTQLEIKNKELEVTNIKLNDHNQNLMNEINSISASRTFKLAKLLSKIWKFIRFV